MNLVLIWKIYNESLIDLIMTDAYIINYKY